jgi:phosphatidylserine/phosphatidylglycerophosphate/cardiolipin synthase-like enzyme
MGASMDLRYWLGLGLYSGLLSTCIAKPAGPVATKLADNQSSPNSPITIVPGDQYLKTIKQLLVIASSSVDILQFNFFSESSPMKDLADDIVHLDAANPNMKIRVALESEKGGSDPKGPAVRNGLTRDMLQHAGIDYSPVFGLRGGRFKGVNHAKVVRVDDQILSGSTNWTNTSLTKNNEINALVDSKTLASTFRQYLDEVIADPGSMHPFEVADGNVVLLTDTTYYAKALGIIDNAQSGDKLRIAMYFFAYRCSTDVGAKAIFDALVGAHQRGVVVTIMMERNSDQAVSPDVTKSNFKVAKDLIAAGITEVYFDLESKISHTKLLLYNDSIALFGSTNWYRGDFDENHQLNWMIRDSAAVNDLISYFDKKLADEGTIYSPQLSSGVPNPICNGTSAG